MANEHESAADGGGERVLAEGRFLRMVSRGGWEFVRRTGSNGVVGVVATTPDGRLLLVEQHREPLGRRCVELPAGLVGDVHRGEGAAESAGRELEEETGYRAARLEPLVAGSVSAGLTDEAVQLFRATGLQRVGDGGGEAGSGEDIEVHAVPLLEVGAFLRGKMEAGRSVDLKVWAALWFVGR